MPPIRAACDRVYPSVMAYIVRSYREAVRDGGSMVVTPRRRDRKRSDLGYWDGSVFRRYTDREAPMEDGYLSTLEGWFAVFNQWTHVNSAHEGEFLESIARGAFKETIAENQRYMRCLFQHGRDPQVGMKPLGPIRELEEDDHGARYAVLLFDTSYNRGILPALRDGLYGASFRFRVTFKGREREPAQVRAQSGRPRGAGHRGIWRTSASFVRLPGPRMRMRRRLSA